MGKILLEKMEFFAYHGCLKEERIVGNKFFVDVEIKADLSKAAISDNVADTINYQKVYELVKEQMQEKSHLLEHIAERIISAIFEKYPDIQKVKVKISKLNPPFGGGGKTEKVSVVLNG